MFSAKTAIALTILVGCCGVALDAMSQLKGGEGSRYIGSSATSSEVLVMERGRLARPVADDLCQYKPVMTDEDMLRCGIGVAERREPPRVIVIERRKPRSRR